MSLTEEQTHHKNPACRYGHGDLYAVTNGGKISGFAFLARKDKSQTFLEQGNVTATMFVGRLYTCKVCGYTEFFDNDPALTLTQEEAK